MNYGYLLIGAIIIISLIVIYKKWGKSIKEKFTSTAPITQPLHPQKSSSSPPQKDPRTIAFLEFSVYKDEDDPSSEVPIGRVELELFTKVVPKTCDNFLSLAKVEYKNSVVHRIIPGFMVQMGDYEEGNGRGGASIYGKTFDDENFTMKHTGRGIVSMANSGPNTNGSQFFINFKETPHLDGKHVVFGQVIGGFDVLDILEKMKTDQYDSPIKLVTITNSGIKT